MMASSASKLCFHLSLLCYSSAQALCAPRHPLPPEPRQRLCCAPFPSERQLCRGDAWGSRRGMSPPAAAAVSSSHSQVSHAPVAHSAHPKPAEPQALPVPGAAFARLVQGRNGDISLHILLLWKDQPDLARARGSRRNARLELLPQRPARAGRRDSAVPPTGPTAWPVSCSGHRGPGARRGRGGRSCPVPGLRWVTGCGGPAGGSRGAQRDLC